jgi:aspartate racemase
MQTVGLIGGLSWESTAVYYRLLNEGIRAHLGGLHSAQMLLWSFDFAEIETLQNAGDWQQATTLMIDAAQRLERGGANYVLICSNTMHKMAHEVSAAISIPLLHIADGVGNAAQQMGLRKVGLLATRYTMEQDFYKARLIEQYGLDVVIPDEPGRTVVHDVIYTELCQGIVTDASKQQYLAVINQLMAQGIEAIVLGCTEIGLLIQPSDVSLPVFDTTSLHVETAIQAVLHSMPSD